jgi:2-keto-4-pentenoate hydratase
VASTARLEGFASELLQTWHEGHLQRRADVPIGELSIDEAYEVQALVLARRVAAGERLAGYKVGCTSRAIRAQLGLGQPVFGRLMLPRVYLSGTRLPISHFVDGAVEPEYAFRVERRLGGSNVDMDDVRRALSGPFPGIEVHNYHFFYGTPTAQELIASNALHAALVYAPPGDNAPPAVPAPTLPEVAELAAGEIELWVNGALVDHARGAEILGSSPLHSIAWLVGQLARQGKALEPGELVLPGSAVALHRLSPGDVVEARFGPWGTCVAEFPA